jgi:Tol biopolymer transport system component/tRNA A-37 threonylcarbamoyl transferase component Bud32
MEDLTGLQLGQYRIVEPIGEGGMASVYKAYQPGMDRYVALKILPRHYARDPNFIGRFKQEARVIANLQHVHILPVFDFGEEDEYTYIVMPYIETGTLADLLRGQRVSLARAEKVITQVGIALHYAHSRGLVHRDVKPSNILIDEGGNCLLTDFGIAKIVEGTTEFTQTGATIGTPAYMSPEQILGKKLDGRSDVYSLGIVLYEMVTGRPPFEAETPPAIFVKHLHDPLPLPRTLNPDLPEPVERVILKSLAKSSEDRFTSAKEMVEILQSAVQGRMLEGITLVKAQEPIPTVIEEELSFPEGVPAGVREPAILEKEAAEVLPWRKFPRRAFILIGAAVLALVGGVLIVPRIFSGIEKRAQEVAVAATQAAVATLNAQNTLAVEFASRETSTLSPQTIEPPSPTSPLDEQGQGWRQGRLAFAVKTGAEQALYTYDLVRDESPEFVTALESGERILGPSLSPDGGSVAFFTYSGPTTVLDLESGSEVQSVFECGSPTWSPDGTKVICTAKGRREDRFRVLNAATCMQVDSIDPDVENAVIPVWSPTRDEIAFATLGEEQTSIYRTTPLGPWARLLAGDSSENYAPAWSPDGEWIAFQSRKGSQDSDIWIMDRNGENMRRITYTSEGWSRAPAFSPDGHWVAYISSQVGSIGNNYGEVFVISLETGEKIQVTSTGGRVYDWRVSWSE